MTVHKNSMRYIKSVIGKSRCLLFLRIAFSEIGTPKPFTLQKHSTSLVLLEKISEHNYSNEDSFAQLGLS